MTTSEDRDELKNTSFDKELGENSALITEEKMDQEINKDDEMYSFGWSSYSEITNGRLAMIGIVILLIKCLN